MQYFRPGGNRFVGDCMPFSHDGVFHLVYLLDEDHHASLGGLGGHQWAHASTPDLVHWTHHPLLLAIEHEDEGSICTGSVFVHGGFFHAFFATRRRDYTQHLGRAISEDGVHFTKCDPNPFFSPPPDYDPCDCRDPFVFEDERGGFHMLVTAQQAHPALAGRGGCLLHLTSDDLVSWTQGPRPFYVPGSRGVPECPDWFHWNGWYYLLFGLGLQTRYRMSRQPLGPWQRPSVDVLDSPKAAVMKTALFGDGRRIGAAWLGSRRDDRDDGAMLWGGNLVLRELVQNPDGTLGTHFVPEFGLPEGRGPRAAGPSLSEPDIPPPPVGRCAERARHETARDLRVPPGNLTASLPPDQRAGEALPPIVRALTDGVAAEGSVVRLEARESLAVAALEPVPADGRIRLRVRPEPGCGPFGLGLRGEGDFAAMYDLAFDPAARTARLEDEVIAAVDGLDRPFDLEAVCCGDIVDVCLDGRRCLLNRLPGRRGPRLFLYAEYGRVAFEAIEIEALAG